jgi:hypothetical protein
MITKKRAAAPLRRIAREAAEVAFITLACELPGTELEDPFMPPTPRPKPGMH